MAGRDGQATSPKGTHIIQTNTAHGATGRSMIGRQADSRKNSLPAFSFGNSANREQQSKLYLTSQHVAIEKKCTCTPGHVYEPIDSLTKQVESLKVNSPKYTFSTLDRMKPKPPSNIGPGSYTSPSSLGTQFESSRLTATTTKFLDSPRSPKGKQFIGTHALREQLGTLGADPGTYELPGALGRQVLATKKSSPAPTLYRTENLREKLDAIHSPPPGSYSIQGSVGKQTLSNFPSSPQSTFGKVATRDNETKRFVTGHHIRELKGTESPPHFNNQTEQLLTTFGRQQASNRNSMPAYGFGSTPKMVFKTSNTPGPGSYDN